MPNSPEDVPIADKKIVPVATDNNGNKLGEQAAELLTTLAKGEKVDQKQLSQALAPALGDAKHHSLAPAAKMMLGEFSLVDTDKDGGATAEEIGKYVQKNADRLAKAPKIEDPSTPWYEKAFDKTAAALDAVSKFKLVGEASAVGAGAITAIRPSDEQVGNAAVKAMLTKDNKSE